MNLILEESQCNITSCLLNNIVPCIGTAEPPTSSGTNPQILTNSHSAWLTKHLSYRLILALFQIPLAGNKNSQRNMSIPGKDLVLFWQAALKKSKLQDNRKRQESRDQRKSSKIRLQRKKQSGHSDANVSVVRGELEMKTAVNLRLLRLWRAHSRRNWWRTFRYWRWVLVLFRAVD